MIKLKIITPQGLYYENEVDSIHTKTVDGEIMILKNHIPIVAILVTSKLVVRFADDSKVFALSGGLLQFANNEMRILADAIEGSEEIDIERARIAKTRAEEKLRSETNRAQAELIELDLKRAINRIDVHTIKR